MTDNAEKERASLHKTIWNVADKLRGSVEGWDFKNYVLGMLFYRFISENLCRYLNDQEHECGNTSFDYAGLNNEDISDELVADIVREKGFFIRPSVLFSNVRNRAKNDDNINETLAAVFKEIEGSAIGSQSENDIKGLFNDIDVNNNRLGSTVRERNKRLITIMDGIAGLPLVGTDEIANNSTDLFGDAYEFLLSMYASGAGKSGGEFFTPQAVSELLAKLTIVNKTSVNKVYDPACGSGALLLQFAKVLGQENIQQGFFGQEINWTTHNLCRINMFLHNINYSKFDIAHGDTLTNPSDDHNDQEPFEAIVSNPPYSVNWEGKDNPLLINDPRFSPAGVLAPKSKADLAFVMHILSWLAVDGTAAIVEFPGVLYRVGAEQEIRKYLVTNNFIDAVIQLPENLFFGTSIATCILVLKKAKHDNAVLFIDASNEFSKGTNENKLLEKHRSTILNTYKDRKDVEFTARLVEEKEIEENDYNLSVRAYVEPEDTSEEIDILTLNQEIEEIVNRQSALRSEIDSIVKELEGGAS